MAKTAEDVRKSREERERLRMEWGGIIPSSVWDVNYSVDGGIYRFGKTQDQVASKWHADQIKAGAYDISLRTVVGSSNKSVRGKDGGLSVFPYDLACRTVQFYSEPMDIVLDPCAGHNSRMQAVYELGRSYIGYDVCHEFMEFNRGVIEKVLHKEESTKRLLKRGTGTIVLREQSSESMVEDDSSVDLIFTSPPYWDLEYYDEDPRQLGYGKTYNQFLEGLGRIASESIRVLKPDKFCVINVNDFRKDGQFYPYHSDIIPYFEDVGFALWDIIIVRWKSSFGTIFASQIEKTKRMPKQHEYLVVFKKPMGSSNG